MHVRVVQYVVASEELQIRKYVNEASYSFLLFHLIYSRRCSQYVNTKNLGKDDVSYFNFRTSWKKLLFDVCVAVEHHYPMAYCIYTAELGAINYLTSHM